MSTEIVSMRGMVSPEFRSQWLARGGGQLQRLDAQGVFKARHDAAEVAFTQRALTYIATEVFPTLIPPLKARQFIPTAAKADPGAEFYVWRRPTRTGIARLFAPGAALDLPPVGLFVDEVSSRFYPVGCELRYDYF